MNNILQQAMSLIETQPLLYFAFIDRTTMANGMLVPSYAPAINVKGSIQPVPRTLMEFLGLDMQRNYVNIFISQSIIDIDRDVSSDKFQYRSVTYQVLSLTKWENIAGFNQALCVQVPDGV